MDKDKAFKIILANAYCTQIKLSCDKCPLFEENSTSACDGFTDDKLIEAIKVFEQ